MNDEYNYKGYTIKIMQDTEPENPRDWDNLGTMYCSHRRYTLGDEQFEAYQFDNWDEVKTFLVKERGASVVLPLSLYDHSGISMKVGVAHGWDSGQVGFIYVTAEDIRRDWSVQRISKKLRARIEQQLRDEVEVYSQYLEGDVYGYEVTDENGEDVESVWGFYGYDHVRAEAESVADSHVPARQSKFAPRASRLHV